MHLTEIAFRLSNHIKFQHIPGNILIGKHRIWPRLTPKTKRYMLRNIETEVNNMKLISRPFISEAETKLVRDEMLKEKEKLEKDEKWKKIASNKSKMNDRLVSDFFEPLRFHRVWE